jgi:hypothetical protein
MHKPSRRERLFLQTNPMDTLDDAGLGSSRKTNPMQAVSPEKGFCENNPMHNAVEEQRSNLQKQEPHG